MTLEEERAERVRLQKGLKQMARVWADYARQLIKQRDMAITALRALGADAEVAKVEAAIAAMKGEEHGRRNQR